MKQGGFPAVCCQLLPSVVCVCVCVFCVLTSSQVGRGGQVSEVIQADDINDGADHSRMILYREGEGGTDEHVRHDWTFYIQTVGRVLIHYV